MPFLVKQRFAIDRQTGRQIGPQPAFSFTDSKYQALAAGNKDNAYVTTNSTVAKGEGIHLATVHVKEFYGGGRQAACTPAI
ncbi:hypothetical protein [Noviherbaspirillum galbum]|uniref:Uncharacterized protein n=1 Tax=Noviherbaspirillum galbum TaxID=2709383 RepID=A0A6B3SSR3_9BURK|nr:hypothetical protein [Noviherbaspirillum galbum]NEX63704.1 hypothetical protein [Noviherbaspirillum galbum]